jgi:hypothetical protein
MSEKISMVRRLRLEANGLGEFQTYASREYQRLLLDAADEIERLGKERDEARMEVCEWEHHWDKTSSEQYYADKRGWDCFKDNA